MKNSTAVLVGIGVVGVLGLAGYALYSYTKGKQQQQQIATNTANTALDAIKQAAGAGVDYIKAGIQAQSVASQAAYAPSSQPVME